MKTFLSLILVLLLASSAYAADGKHIAYQVNGANYEGYYISAGAKAPLVLLVHDWDGLNDYEVKRSQMLADLGYSVFAADLFGAGVRPTQMEDMRRLTNALYQDRNKMRALLYGAMDAAKAQGADLNNAVAMGYCFGGTAVLELARSGAELKGFVTFHGGLATPDAQDYAKAKGKYLILHGSADTAVTLDDFVNLGKALEARGLNHELITYSGAPHAFTVWGSNRYHKEADEKSWQRFVGFLKETLV